MADEYVCEDCAYSSLNEEKDCPLCGGKIVSLEEGLEKDQSYDDASGQDEASSPMDDDFDFDTDPAI